MKASQILINKLKEFEGCELTAYQDSVKVWTIGIGHTAGVKKGQKITLQQAEVLCKGDLLKVETYLNSLKISFTQGQFDALCDFAFNLGTGALANSTLLKKIRANMNDKTILDEFVRWIHAGGKVLPGLVKRRNWEAMRWQQK
jgi:lysozyme